MDLLSQRYASPFLVLDEFIRLQQLHEFSIEVLQIIADEKTHAKRWDYYVHRVWNKTFEEYVDMCENPQTKEEMSHDDIGDVINKSKIMLEGFNPE